MIDVEIDLFDGIAKAILAEFETAFVSSQHVEAPPQFPAVSIIETSNVEEAKFNDMSEGENASALTYTVNVYDNSQENAKQTCKRIVQIISSEMHKRNMIRSMCAVMDNAKDPSIFRMVARFTGIVDKNLVMYRR